MQEHLLELCERMIEKLSAAKAQIADMKRENKILLIRAGLCEKRLEKIDSQIMRAHNIEAGAV
jgi:hypothetical protein